MAISHIATGTWAELTADGTVTIPAGSADGDRLYLLASWKAFGTTATVAGWSELTEFADGSTAAGNGTGSMKVGCWYFDRGASAPSNPTLDFSVSPVPAAAVIIIFRKGGSDIWQTPSFRTAAITNWTSSSQTVSASATVTIGDGGVVIGLAGIRDDSATFTRPTTGIDAASGVTWNGNYVEAPATHHSSTTSNDMAADAGYRLVTTGGSAITLRQTATLSAAETGSALWIIQNIVTAITEIRDQFLTDDAAPVTSPRDAEPGPGEMTAVDTENVIKILNDRLRGFPQTTPVWGDARVEYTPIVRAQGRVFAALVTLMDEAAGLALGLATSSPSADPSTNGYGWITSPTSTGTDLRDIYAITPGLRVLLDGSDKSILTSRYLVVVVLNTQGAVILLSTFGDMDFISIGGSDRVGIPAYPSARVLYVSDALTTTPLYPYVSAYLAAGTVHVDGHAIEDLRVMDVSAWSGTDALAALVDRFTRANSTTTLGGSWTAHAGTWGINTNQGYVVASGSFSTATIDSGIADGIVSCDITVPGDWNGSNYGFGIILRSQDSSNFLRLWNDFGNSIKLHTWVAGAFGASVFSTAFTWTAGQTYRLTCYMDGAYYHVLIDGVSQSGTIWQQDTNSRFITATRHGLYGHVSSNPRWDNFTVYPHTVSLPSTPFDDGARPKVITPTAALASDVFTDTNGTRLNAHTAGAGGAWTEHLGTWEIQSNRASMQDAAAGGYMATQDLGRTDIEASVDVIFPSSFPTGLIRSGIAFRFVDTSNYMFARVLRDTGTGEIEIGETIAGAGAVVAKCRLPQQGVSETHTLKIQVIGDNVQAFYDGNAVLAHYMRAGSPNGTRHGLFKGESEDGATYDNWTVAAADALFIPTTTALGLTTFAPTVTAGAGQNITPSTTTLTLSTFAPTVTATDHKTVTPTTTTLTTTAFAPTVTASDHKLLTPTTASLALATFTPTVSTTAHQTSTPTTATLALTSFAPTVAATAHQTVTPSTASLTTSVFAPTVTASDHKLVTPTTATVSLSTFAPTVSATAHQTVTPTTASLSLTTFAPGVAAGQGLTITPGLATLTTATFAPTVSLTDHQTLVPVTASLALTTFAPTVTASSHQTLVPTTAALVLLTFAPTVLATDPQLVTPTTASLSLATFAPTVSTAPAVPPLPRGAKVSSILIAPGGSVTIHVGVPTFTTEID